MRGGSQRSAPGRPSNASAQRAHAALASRAEAVGLSPEGLRASIDAAARGGPTPAPLTDAEINQLAAEVFAADSPLLSRHHSFTRCHVIAEVAPRLYGHDPAELAPIVERLLSVSGVSALPRTPGVREQAYRFTGY